MGYKINTHKSVAFLYTNNEKSEREIKETILFTTVTKRIKYLEINLSKEAKTCIQKSVRHWFMKNRLVVSVFWFFSITVSVNFIILFI